MDFEESDQFDLRQDLVVEEIDDEVVVLDLAGNQYFGLNEVAWLIWRAIDEEQASVGAIVTELADVFEISETRARNDVEAFIGQLVEAELATQMVSEKIDE